MKAILVIDMPDDMRIEDTQALNVTLYNGMYVCEVTMNRHLKPLPEKLDYTRTDAWADRYRQGYNACLEEIDE